MTIPSSEVDRIVSAGPVSLPLSQTALQHKDGCPVQPQDAAILFPAARDRQAALAGLLLRMGCWAESHTAAQDIHSAEGSYWHGILHRMEPDSFNAEYWFGKVGQHPIFPDLFRRATEILDNSGPKHWRLKTAWDPFVFIEWCDEARATGGQLEAAAVNIQMAEWELLFNWCSAKQG